MINTAEKNKTKTINLIKKINNLIRKETAKLFEVLAYAFYVKMKLKVFKKEEVADDTEYKARKQETIELYQSLIASIRKKFEEKYPIVYLSVEKKRNEEEEIAYLEDMLKTLQIIAEKKSLNTEEENKNETK